MKKILAEYQERLINLSSTNMSLYLKKINKKSAFDIVVLEDYFNGKVDEIIQFIRNGEKSIILMQNPSKWRSEKKKEVENSIKNLKENFLDTYKNYTEKMENSQLEHLKDIDYKTEVGKKKVIKVIKEDLEKKLEKEHGKLLLVAKGLDYLKREIDAEIKETGISNLFIALYFIEGKFNDGSYCRAPLCLIPIAIMKEGSDWILRNDESSELEVNKVFLLSAIKNNELKLVKKDFKLEYKESVVKQFIEYYKLNGIEIEINEGKFLKMVDSFKGENLDYYSSGELRIKENIILGRFPTSNAIYEDYDLMIQNDLKNDQIESLFKGSDISTNHEKDGINEERDLNEKEFFFISNLDYAQEQAVRGITENQNLVVFGPPGTGKSETIANIISDNLAKGKRVLMVSQKRAALDVIYNRLSNIKSKLVLIHDAKSGKKEFYEKIKVLIEDYQEIYGDDFYYTNKRSIVRKDFKSTETKIEEEAIDVEKQLDKFRDLHNELYKTRENGLSLQNMCHCTWNINSLTDYQNKYLGLYYELKNQLPLLNKSQTDLVKFIELINKKKLNSKLIKFDEMKSLNQYISEVKESPDFSVLYSIKDEIKCIQDELDSLDNKVESEDFVYIYNLFLKSENHRVEVDEVETYIEDKYSYLVKPIAVGINRFIKEILMRKKFKYEEEKNKQQFKEILEENKRCFVLVNDIIRRIESCSRILALIFNDQKINVIIERALREFEFIKFEDIIYVRNNYNDFLSIKSELKEFTSNEIDFLQTLRIKIKDKDEIEDFISLYANLSQLDLMTHKLQYEKDIVRIGEITKNYSSYVMNANIAMKNKRELTNEYIKGVWDQKFIDVARRNSGFKEFKRIANFKRKFRPIRQYFENFDDVLMNMFPCFLMGPETVSKVLPMNKNMFDLIVFDEASQLFVEEAIPALFRAKKAVVAGDDKQLKPSSLFRKNYNEVEENDFDVEAAAALEEESLLDLAKVTYIPTHLKFHYRSQFSELINFSNYAYYNGNLVLSPNISNSDLNTPITRVLVKDGMWQNRRNSKEAKEVVQTLKQIFENRKNNETIGIITFNKGQLDAITDEIDLEMANDEYFEGKVSAERNRKKGDEDIGLFIKNIENVQGDERDIIIFSTGYARNSKNKLVQSFGSLSQVGGEFRLNVAISRAKKKIYVITSFEPEELDVTKSKNLGPVRFKQYLQYVRAVSQKNKSYEKQILKMLVDSKEVKSNVNEIYFEDSFENQVYDRLTSLGYNVHTKIGVSGYRIDLAVYDDRTSTYIMGIECDGISYHSSISARERDIHRQKFLETRGWKIVRIWSYDWWKDKTSVIKSLKESIDANILAKHNECNNNEQRYKELSENSIVS